MPTLLDVLYRRELYRRWCDGCVGSGSPASDEAPPDGLLDVVLTVDLENLQTDEMAAVASQAVKHLADVGPDTALGQLIALRAAVLATAAQGEALPGFHSLIDLAMAEVARATIDRLQREATTDPLTRLANRRRLLEDLRRELARAERSGHPLTLVIIDIDHLKATNDTYGHHAGDQRIIDLADRIRATLRQGDAAYRVGGDEFVLVLPDTRPSSLAADGTRGLPAVLQRLADDPDPGFSWGLASCPADGTEPDSLLRAADERMIRLRQTARSIPR